MAEQDTHILEMLLGQVREDRDIYPVLGKALVILGQAERGEPFRNRRHTAIPLGGCAAGA